MEQLAQSSELFTNDKLLEILDRKISTIKGSKSSKCDHKLMRDIHMYQIYVNEQDNGLSEADRERFEVLHEQLALVDDESVKNALYELSIAKQSDSYNKPDCLLDVKKNNKNSKIDKIIKNEPEVDPNEEVYVPKKRGRKPKNPNGGKSVSSSVSTKFLDKYNLPDNVKVTAARLFNIYSQGEVKKVSKRKGTLFMAIKEAYKEHGIIMPPDNIRVMLNMDKREMSRAKTLYSYPRTGIRSTQIDNSPLEYIPTYCRELKIPEDVRDLIVVLGKSIMDLDDELSDSKPQNIAAGIIAYGMTLYGMSIDNKLIAEAAKISMATLGTSLDYIKIVHANA